MSHQVEELLASLDHFKFSSGQKLPLSSNASRARKGTISATAATSSKSRSHNDIHHVGPSSPCPDAENGEGGSQIQHEQRKQEILALQQLWEEAQNERTAARRWVHDVQKAVWTWVEKQQDLMRIQKQQHELQEHKKRQQKKESMSVDHMNTTLLASYQHVIQRQQTTIEQLEMELQNCMEHTKNMEKKLNDLVPPHRPHHQQQAQPSVAQENNLQQYPRQSLTSLHHASTTKQPFSFSQAVVSNESPNPYIRTVSPPTLLDTNHMENQRGFTNLIYGDDHAAAVGAGVNNVYRNNTHHPNVSPIHPSTTMTMHSTSSSCPQHMNNNNRRRKYCCPETGSIITMYGNGSQKECLPDGTCIVRFPNGDIQTIGTDGSVAYLFAATSILQIQQLDGTKQYQYPNGQLEHHGTDGSKVIYFTDGTMKNIEAPHNAIVGQQQYQHNHHHDVYQKDHPSLDQLSVVVEPSLDDPDPDSLY